MRAMMVLAALAVLGPGAAAAQTGAGEDLPEICTCDPPIQPRKLPSEAALALGRRLAAVIDQKAIDQRVWQLVQLAESKGGPAPVEPTYPKGPIRAVGQVPPAKYPMLGIYLRERAIDHAGLVHAWRYSQGELQAMVDFLESAAGKTLLADSPPTGSAEVRETLASKLLEDDLWNLLCGTPLPSGPENAPHHEAKRLHPPVPSGLEVERPVWCVAPVPANQKISTRG